MTKHEHNLGVFSLSWYGDINACETAVLNSGDSIEDNLGDADTIDPADSGLPLPRIEEEPSDAEEAYNSMIRRGVADYTLTELSC